MVSRLVPIVESSARILSFEPWPIDIMMITAATPMMIPSIERKERILLFATAFRLTLKRFSMFIFFLFTVYCLRFTGDYLCGTTVSSHIICKL